MSLLALKAQTAMVLFLALGLSATPLRAGPAGSARATDAAYLDVLDLHGAPRDASDRSFNIFFDAGAWHGYSLPPAGDLAGGFSGPFVHSLDGGRWAGERFARLVLRDAGGQGAAPLAPLADHAGPGYLQRNYAAPGLAVRQTLFFADSWRTLVRIELTSTRARSVELAIEGSMLPSAQVQLERTDGVVTERFPGSSSTVTTRWRAEPAQATVTQDGYRIALRHPLSLEAGRTATLFVEQTLQYDAATPPSPQADAEEAWTRNRARWRGYLDHVATAQLPGVPDATARHVALKAVQTLIGNWRAARGDLRHAGVIPSYSNPDFNGFWAWDSWKHAAALARFAPALARDQMRAMFDYQQPDGMVIDCIYLDRKDNNRRNSKPPLAAWATMEIYRATGDKAFLAQMYDKLVRYHRWWATARDHDRNGLAEFGSTDGTRIAAAWESGMDNAVRFDAATMVRNGKGAWSLDQESVDLNAYLYREKLELADAAAALGKPRDRAAWLAEARTLAQAVRTRMFDAAAGWFFDTRLGTGEPVHVFGPEGWTPLWAGLADPDQARAVARVMLDPQHFATVMPFPTLARNDPRFSPIKGYWRGPVWLDQAWFGVEALRRYGYTRDADAMARRLVLDAQGLARQAPIYENYDPLTGHGYQSPNFSWSAASYLLMFQVASHTP